MDRQLDNIGAILSGVIALLFTVISIVFGNSQSFTIPLELGAIIGCFCIFAYVRDHLDIFSTQGQRRIA